MISKALNFLLPVSALAASYQASSAPLPSMVVLNNTDSTGNSQIGLTYAYFGSFAQNFTGIEKAFQFDTTSSWTVIANLSCTNCDKDQYYNSRNSSSSYEGSSRTVKMGDATLQGAEYTDKVCLDAINGTIGAPNVTDCILDYRFLAITSQNNFQYSGSLGMAPYQHQPDISEGQSYLQHFFQFKNFADESRTVEWRHNVDGPMGNLTEVTIGRNKTQVKGVYGATYGIKPLVTQDGNIYNYQNGSNWAINYGGSNYSNMIDNDTAIIDSTSAFINLTATQWINWQTEVNQQPAFTCNQGKGICSTTDGKICDPTAQYMNTIPGINITLGNYQYSIPNKSMCGPGSDLNISLVKNNYPVVLGNPFLKIYRALFDYAQNTVSFATTPMRTSTRMNYNATITQTQASKTEPSETLTNFSIGNVGDLYYSSGAFFGSPSQTTGLTSQLGATAGVGFQYSSVDVYTSVAANNCTTCPSEEPKPYNYQGKYSASGPTSMIKNGITEQGRTFNDRVCLAYSKDLQDGVNCVKNLQLFVVEEQKQPTSTNHGKRNNMLGLAPYAGSSSQVSFVQELFDFGQITSRAVNWSMTSSKSSKASSISFGPKTNGNYMQSSTANLNLKYPQDQVWQVDFNGTMFTSAKNISEEGLYFKYEQDYFEGGSPVANQTAIINTTSPMIYLPKLEWNSYLKVVSAIPGVDCSEGTFPWSSQKEQVCRAASLSCTQLALLMPSLTFNLDEKAFTIPPIGLCIEDSGTAVIPIQLDPKERVILGFPWLRAFYTSFNYSDKTVFFSPNAYSGFNNSKMISKVTKPEDENPLWLDILIWVGIIAVLLLICACFYCFYKKQQGHGGGVSSSVNEVTTAALLYKQEDKKHDSSSSSSSSSGKKRNHHDQEEQVPMMVEQTPSDINEPMMQQVPMPMPMMVQQPLDKLMQGVSLQNEEEVRSQCGTYSARMQGDGNFVVYKHDASTWASDTMGKGQAPYRCEMQEDGNLVVYDGTNAAIWASDSNGNGNAPYELEMQSDGNLVIYSNHRAEAIWATGTNE